jgi:hypothetical protein
MKQFKHKKTGAEATQIQIGDYKSGNYIIPQTIIEDSSDWEEVKEKEYTILSFISPNGVIRNLTDNEEYVREDGKCPFSLEKMLELDKIHSVRRQRDQEVFTLRDQMKALTTDSKNVTLFVEKIELIGDRIHLWGNNYSISLMCAEKAPIRKPILITEDGKEIYEGDNYSLFSVLTKANWQEGRRSIKHALEFSSEWKHFHTKEAREEYIKWNKPMYSLRDVENATFGSVEVTEYLEKLGRK